MILIKDEIIEEFFVISRFIGWIVLSNAEVFCKFNCIIIILVGLILLLFFIFIKGLCSLAGFLFTGFLLL